VGLEHSRALLLASGVSGRTAQALEQLLEQNQTAVTVDPTVSGALLATRVLLTTLRRQPGRLVLLRGEMPHPILQKLEEAVAAIDPTRPLQIVRDWPNERAIRVHVGADGAGLRALPEGFGGHLVRDRQIRLPAPATVHPLGAIFTAALAAGEVFKEVAAVLPARRRGHRHLRFCPVSLSARPGVLDTTLRLDLDLVLFGTGAVGTGAALILSESDGEGRIGLVDEQRYAPENRGTYSLGGQLDVIEAPWKVDVAKRALEAQYTVTTFPTSVDTFVTDVDRGSAIWPRMVLCALDSREARHRAQDLWPDVLIDGATGDTALGLHVARAGEGPCVRCFLPVLDQDGPSVLERLASITGLPISSLIHGDELLPDEEVDRLPPAQRALLEPHRGTLKCGLAQAFGLTSAPNEAGYRPSIPFVSLQAACLMVGRLIALRLGVKSLPNFVQYDALIGPDRATQEVRPQDQECYCAARAAVIAQVR